MGQLAILLGARIRQLRAERGLSQRLLAENVGVSDEWLRRIESGAATPSLDVVEALATGLGVPAYLLFVSDQRSAKLESLVEIADGLDMKALEWVVAAAQLAARK